MLCTLSKEIMFKVAHLSELCCLSITINVVFQVFKFKPKCSLDINTLCNTIDRNSILQIINMGIILYERAYNNNGNFGSIRVKQII